jgi:hypothetical protein
MGKNFSCNQVREKRNKNDSYSTPYSMTEQLLEVEQFDGTILEPACGQGAIVKVIHKTMSNNIISHDIQDDFLSPNYDVCTEVANIITNPPFSLALEFIQKAKSIYTKKIAMLLPLSYLHGQKRYESKIFSELKCVHVFTRYPLLEEEIREDGKYRTGMMVYAWFVWQKGHNDKPYISWIDNNRYVIGKTKCKK